MCTQRTLLLTPTAPSSALPRFKSTSHARPGEPADGEDVQYDAEDVLVKAVGSIAGLELVKSTIVRSSVRLGNRQPDTPPKVSDAQ